MKKLFTFLMIIAITTIANAQFSVVVLDSLTDGGLYKDNALLFTPEGFEEPQASYVVEDITDGNDVTFPALNLSEEALGDVTGAFQSWPSFDYIFPKSIDRNPGDSIVIEFDLMFSSAGGSGEGGRVNITLLSELPDGGITETDFGIPAYHFWLFNGNYSAALSYGGEYEDNPGWNSGADGYYYNENAGNPDEAVLFPGSDNYPLVPYSKNQSGTAYFSTTQWKHYTWVIAQDMMHLYWRDTGADPSEDEEIAFMAIPKDGSIEFINEVHETFAASLPPGYQWFEMIDGIRFWARGAGSNDTYFTNLKITKSGTPVSTYAEFQNRPASQRRPKADAGSYELPILLYNGTDGGTTSVTVELVDGDAAHVDDFTSETVVFENTTTDLQSQALPLTIVDLYQDEPAVLVFEITNVEGGDFATAGPNKQFELTIRPSGAEPNSIHEESGDFITLYPNPAINSLRIINERVDQDFMVQIFDITGKMVLSNKSIDEQIDVSFLKDGVYYIRLSGKEQIITKKFLKK